MKRNGFKAFQHIQMRKPAYLVSPYSLHEQAIREHIQRGFAEGLTRKPGLLDQANRIDHV